MEYQEIELKQKEKILLLDFTFKMNVDENFSLTFKESVHESKDVLPQTTYWNPKKVK